MKLKDYPLQNFKFKVCEGTFGIEIETEVPSVLSYPPGFLNPKTCEDTGQFVDGVGYVKEYRVWDKSWKGVVDGSLRNFGVEYIVKAPHSYEGILHAIDEFHHETKGIPFIEDAPGTSVHVHVNMQSEEILTLCTMITLWTLLENVLVEYCGEGRRSNLFARPVRVSEGNLQIYQSMITRYMNDQKGAFLFSEGQTKYSALNVQPLDKLGSIEFRTLRGTTDPEILKGWVTILNDLLVYSRGHKPSDVLRLYNSGGPEGVLSILSDRSFLSSIDNIEARIDHNLEYTYRLVRTTDWDDLKNKTFEVEKKSKKVKTISSMTEAQEALYQMITAGGGLQISPSEPMVYFDDVYSPEGEEE